MLYAYAYAYAVTPPRREVNGQGGLRAPGSRLLKSSTRVAPQICMEPRDGDVSSDRRNVPWSPENILINTVAWLQQYLADSRAESRQLRTPEFHLFCRPLGRLRLRQPKYHGLEERPVGSSTGRCLTL